MDIQTIRAFFAVALETQAKTSCVEVISTLKNFFEEESIRWIKPENLHITLQFIAKLNPNDIPSLLEKVTAKVSAIDSFEINFSGVELFPSSYSPKVISLKVENEDNLLKLSKLIGEVLSELAYPEEKKVFRAHLSLGRINDNEKKKISLPQILLPTISPMRVTKIDLFQSKSIQMGRRYLSIKDILLQSSHIKS